jgi:hypothetical protein
VEQALRDGNLAPDAHLVAAALLAWAGEGARARAVLAPSLAAEDAATKLFAEVMVALLDLAARRFDAAHEAAKRAREHASAAAKNVRPGPLSEHTTKALHAAAAWTLLATSLLTKRPADAPRISTPDIYERPATDWAAVVAAGAAARREVRFRMHTLELGLGEQAALPAVIHVLREAASDGRDPDVWIDAVFPLYDARLNGITGMRARAEAARWRGDTDAARRWDERAAALEERASNPRRALLARLAGLD